MPFCFLTLCLLCCIIYVITFSRKGVCWCALKFCLGGFFKMKKNRKSQRQQKSSHTDNRIAAISMLWVILGMSAIAILNKYDAVLDSTMSLTVKALCCLTTVISMLAFMATLEDETLNRFPGKFFSFSKKRKKKSATNNQSQRTHKQPQKP